MSRFSFAAATGAVDKNPDDQNGGRDKYVDRSTERLMDSELGYSPWLPRIPTRDEFIEAMLEWGKRKGVEFVVKELETGIVIIELDGRIVAVRKVS